MTQSMSRTSRAVITAHQRSCQLTQYTRAAILTCMVPYSSNVQGAAKKTTSYLQPLVFFGRGIYSESYSFFATGYNSNLSVSVCFLTKMKVSRDLVIDDGRDLLFVAALIAMPASFSLSRPQHSVYFSIHPRRVAGSIASWSGHGSVCLKSRSSSDSRFNTHVFRLCYSPSLCLSSETKYTTILILKLILM